MQSNTRSSTEYLRDVLLVFLFFLTSLKLLQKYIKQWHLSRKLGKDETQDIYKAYRSVPGPPSFPFIGNAINVLPKHGMLERLLNLGIKHGHCFKLTNPLTEDLVFLNSPEAVQAILSSHEHLRKSYLLEKLCPSKIDTTMAILPGGEKWKSMRKILARPFMYKALQIHNPCFYKQSERMTSQLEERFINGNSAVNTVDDLLKQCIFGMASESLMGVDLEDVEDGAKFCKNLELLMQQWITRVYRPWLLIPWIWKISSSYRIMEDSLNSLTNVIFKVLDIYKKKLNEEPDNDDLNNNTMAGVMLKNGIEPMTIFREVAVMLGIANETTPSAAEYTLFMLALHPNHQELCRQEIDAAFDDPSKCHNGVLEFEALKELKHLERCIQESLRMNPVSLSLRTLETPLRINEELVLPSNVSVIVLPYILHNNPKYFPNPEQFEPERFLPENVRERHHYAYVPFSAGPRNCIGMKLSMVELKVIMATILRKFEVRTPDTRESVQLEMDPTMKPLKPIRFTMTKRILT
ncbi:unnamed protein product [Orchesella dallaii]|uniref:Cytochrome P450 4C1 n=1 Tax=Orchesella dallaii TaxID=48710 RepID=A0ABP1Q110_9HEXA